MKKILRLSLLLIFNFSLQAQNTSERGVEVPKNAQSQTQGKTWAILIGVSDYQNVRDLQYADRDAEVFYGYLTEVAKVPKENIFLFTNQRANLKNVSNAITKLDTLAKSGDKFIFFFAGHGDIEAENRPDETALLLLYDSPNGNYLAAQDGYIKLIDLKEAFDKFTANNISVQFYADACRSGAFNLINNVSKADTLKGGVKGRNRFLNGIQQPWLNQIKYVSCQVNENSLEGAEYSCGRGLFSLHLIDGLMGMADTEKDGKVTFAELRQYVDKMVRTQAKPRSQNPQKVNGDDNEDIALVDSTAFAKYQLKQKVFTETHLGDCSPFLSGTNIKGDSTLLTDIDPQFREDYKAFYKNLKVEKLLYPESDNAKKSFLSFEEKLKKPTLPKSTTQFLKIVAGNMKADLIDALQKGCMNIIKPLLFKVSEYTIHRYAEYDTAHIYMQEVFTLIDREHFLYKNYKVRDLYLQAKLAQSKPNEEIEHSDKVFIKADSLLRYALFLEPDMPYILSKLGDINKYLDRLDESIFFYKRGYELIPNSPIFVNGLASIYDQYGSIEQFVTELKKIPDDPISNAYLASHYANKKDFEKVNFFVQKTISCYNKLFENQKTTNYYYSIHKLYDEIGDIKNMKMYADSCYKSDSSSYYGLMSKINSLYSLYNISLTQPYLTKLIQKFPYDGNARATSALYLGVINPKLALSESKKSLILAPNNFTGLLALSYAYSKNDSLQKAIEIAQKLVKSYPLSGKAWGCLGNHISKLGDIDNALKLYLIADSLQPNDPFVISKIGVQYTYQKEYKKAVSCFRHSIQLDTDDTNVNGMIGLVYWKYLNKIDSAIYFLKKGINDKRTEPSILLILGQIYESMSQKNYDDSIRTAIYYYTQSIEQGKYIDDISSVETARYRLSSYYIKNNEFEKALPIAEELSKNNPKDFNFISQVAAAYYKTNRFIKADSMIVYLQNHYANKSNPIELGIFGTIKYRVKDYKKAEEYLQASLKELKDTSNLYIYAATLSRLKKIKEANEILEKIALKKPNDIAFNLNLGYNLIIQKNYDEAKAVFEKCKILFPNNQFVYFRWASFYAAQNKPNEAIEYIKKALQLGFKDFWRFDDEEFDVMRDNKEFQALINK